MFHPCVANRYEACRVYTPQLDPSLSARAVADVIATAASVTNENANSREHIVVLINFVFISINFPSIF
jgi:hypothetical protein